MSHLVVNDVNHAFALCVNGIKKGSIPTQPSPSRYGDVLRMSDMDRYPEPVILTYTNPRHRVLFNDVRDCNPFFHLYESMWMLAGRNDLDSLKYYVETFDQFSDDGKTIHDAYGCRWREWFGWDQLPPIIEELRKDPTSRRCVLQMWDASLYSESPPLNGIDFYKATHGGKAVPCNVCIFFDVVKAHGHRPADRDEGEDRLFLNMTVINRSNDLVWGTLGANVVHMSMLQEYMANCCGYEVGKYHQISNNQHVYTKNFEPNKWCPAFDQHQPKPVEYGQEIVLKTIPPARVKVEAYPKLVIDQKRFDKEVKEFAERHGKDAFAGSYQEPFLQEVAQSMCIAFHYHKRRQYKEALECVSTVKGTDWRVAGTNWLFKRQKNWEKKNG